MLLNVLEMIDRIENFGRDREYYRIYFKDGGILDVAKKEFIEHDKLYNGKLVLKVVN